MSGIVSIGLSGLNDASLRAANAASNIANAFSSSPLPAPGGTYNGFQPQDVVSLSAAGGGAGPGVASTPQPRTPSDLVAASPTSSNSSANGLVAMPNVYPGTEMNALATAQFSYAANATLVKTGDRMQKNLLDTLS